MAEEVRDTGCRALTEILRNYGLLANDAQLDGPADDAIIVARLSRPKSINF